MPRLSPRAYERVTLVAAVAVGFIIVSGAAVRLTGSGLGCPDWPTCARHHVVAPLSFHPMVEFVNRAVTGIVSLAVVIAVLGSLWREPRRRDLTVLSVGLVLGVVAQIVLGGLTVVHHLAPGFVMGHFALSMAILTNALVLHHCSGQLDQRPPSPGGPIDSGLAGLVRLIAVLSVAVITAGMVVTSAGPHGGDVHARRLDVDLHEATRLHGAGAMLLVVLVVAGLILARAHGAAVVQARLRAVLEALAAQVAIGYTQYFTGVPAVLVGLHVLGAVMVWTSVVRANLALGPSAVHAKLRENGQPWPYPRSRPSRSIDQLERTARSSTGRGS